MSLINEMLRDLEARREREERAAGDVRAVGGARRRRIRGPLATLTALLLVAAGGLLVWNAWSPAVRPGTSQAAGTAARQQPATRPASANTTVLSQRAQSRTTEPGAGVNAKQRTAAPPERLRGAVLEAIVQTAATGGAIDLHFNGAVDYRVKQAAQMAELDISTVTAAPDIGKAVQWPHGVVLRDQALAPDGRLRLTLGLPENLRLVTRSVVHDGATRLRLAFVRADQLQTAHAGEAPAHRAVAAGPPPTVVKTPHVLTPAERAQADYDAGIRLLQQGDSDGAEQRFRAALAADPGADSAREALGLLLQRAGNADVAEEIFAAGMEQGRSQDLFARLYARMLVDKGEVDRAITALRTHEPSVRESPQHFAFLAALEQRKGQDSQAVADYRQALAVDPSQAAWWMGLGISLEKQGQNRDALEAYRRAQQEGGLADTVLRYVKQRIAALSQ